MKKIHKQFMRYLIVGGGAFLTEYGSFYALYYYLHIHLGRANALSFCLGLLVSFILNRVWAFSGHISHKYRKEAHHQFIIFVCLAGINLCLTVAIVALLKAHGVIPRFGKLIAMVLTSGWNFIIYKKLIFNHAPAALQESEYGQEDA